MAVHLFRNTQKIIMIFVDSFTLIAVIHVEDMIQIKFSVCLKSFGCVDIIRCGERLKFFIVLKKSGNAQIPRKGCNAIEQAAAHSI